MSKDIVISVKIPVRLIELIDLEIKKSGYQNRSEFIRDAIRKALNENNEQEDKTYIIKNESEERA